MQECPDPKKFPCGAEVTVGQLELDPYPTYALLQEKEPISWIPQLGMWYVTRYEDVRALLLDTARFTTEAADSLIFDTFGAHMLTTEGSEHDRYRRAVQHGFTPGFVRRSFEAEIRGTAQRLIDAFKGQGEVELRSAFAARLPVQTILGVFGLPLEAESAMRRWYDGFEQALANFARDSDVRRVARTNVGEFHEFLTDAMHHAGKGTGLLSMLVNAPSHERLSDDEIRRNMSIMFFGGISTVEALILNSLWALFTHPADLARLRREPAVIPKVIEETARWLSPVQSATRHVVRDTTYRGVSFGAGAIVNCMLGAANRDPTVFPQPDRFDLDRANAQRHLGFATGVHSCLGVHLAKAEVRAALEILLRELPGLRLVAERTDPPRGYEFRQPRSLHVAWDMH